MARVLILIFFVIGGVAWAVTFAVYAFANPDLAENNNVHCYARNDFGIPISQPPVYVDGVLEGVIHPTWDDMAVNTTRV
jgi:hypothetical protein